MKYLGYDLSKEENSVARPITSGNYKVPDAIQALKPNFIDCIVKAIPTMTKKKGIVIHYYVYQRIPKINQLTGVKEYTSGDTIGKIEGGVYCPNDKGRALLHKLNSPTHSDGGNKSPESTGNKDSSTSQGNHQEHPPMTKEESNAFRELAANMNLNLQDIDLQLKDYGEYALVLACTESVLERLNKYFSVDDSLKIYVLSIIYFLEEYTPASYVKDIFDQSVLSNKWPSLAISENEVSKFLKLLGRHPVQCDMYCQSIINDSSGLTAIDGHVILSCSGNNDLADYGNKYQKIGNKQLNILQAYDVIKRVPIASKAYEGGLPDKTSVQDLLNIYDFPEKTTFLVDMGFYSEEDMGLYRKNGCHFVIPVPENTGISKAIRNPIFFSESFVYEKSDESGTICKDMILYRETTVCEMEKSYQAMLNAEAERKNREAASKCNPGEKPKKHHARKITTSSYGDDRLIIYRDEDMHNKLVSEFRSQIGIDAEHTEERLAELAPEFGIIVLRSNLDKKAFPASVVYKNYKSRWGIETHYNFVANTVKFCGLQTEDYCSMQGLSFLILTVGQIKSAVVEKMKSASSYVSHLSIKECIIKASRSKLSQHIDKSWHVAVTTKKHADLLLEMGVNVEADIKKLNQRIY